MSHGQYGLHRGVHELKLGSMVDADFPKCRNRGDKIARLHASNSIALAKVRLSEGTKGTEEAEASNVCLKS